MSLILARRALVAGLGAGAAGLLSGCDRLGNQPTVNRLLITAENLHMWTQRALQNRTALAREFRPEDRSPIFRSNGTFNPNTEDYKALWRAGFADWRLKVDGMVARPLSLSLAQMRGMPAREQITRHDCVEGWSAIAKWRGVPLARVLDAAGLSDRARYIVFHCMDNMGGGRRYYESIDLVDAFHPQTILAWGMNDGDLPVGHGAPLRLRVERQLGYKHAKFVMAVEAVESLAPIGAGKGGFWEDVIGYDWYAGI